MKLEHSFRVPVPVNDAWPVLVDIKRVAACMPGASVDAVEGETFTGSMKVKLGPIVLTYRGSAKYIERDGTDHRVVISASAREARGNGSATATIAANLRSTSEHTTAVHVLTDLDITGKPAQFGRGVMVDVGNKILSQFAENLADQLLQRSDANEVPGGPANDSARRPGTPAGFVSEADAIVRPVAGQTRKDVASAVEPMDLRMAVGPAVLKRIAPILLLAVVLIVAVRAGRLRRVTSDPAIPARPPVHSSDSTDRGVGSIE